MNMYSAEVTNFNWVTTTATLYQSRLTSVNAVTIVMKLGIEYYFTNTDKWNTDHNKVLIKLYFSSYQLVN